MSRLRHPDVDLPIFKGKLVYPTRGRRTPVVGVETPTFIRRVDIHKNARNIGLKALIAAADKEFRQAAKICGAVVIPHEWGLIATKPGEVVKDSSPMVPTGYRMAAEVPVITPASPNPDTPTVSRDQIHTYQQLESAWKWKTPDCHPHQFMYGSIGDGPDQLYLHDTELYVIPTAS